MKLVYRFAIAVSLAVCGAVAAALACGASYADMLTVRGVAPPHLAEYASGELGIVRPRFERAFLVQAYRRITGLPPVPALTSRIWDLAPHHSSEGLVAWLAIRGTTHVMHGSYDQQYRYVETCPDDAFATAARTYAARAATYGEESPVLREWLRAQNAVFSNCHWQTKTLPDPALPTADALARADREYQIAAAYFYQWNLDEAAKRFRAIATHASSPWRPYGRYLAARALIRSASVTDDDAQKRQFLEQADSELRAVVAERASAKLHDSARGLIALIGVRIRPIERLREISVVLRGDAAVANQQIVDFRLLMDRLVGNTVEFDYASLPGREELTRDDPLVDWIVTMQGTGDAATGRAIAQWTKTRAPVWLVAALWKAPATHREAPALLAAAAQIEQSSPAFATVAFLRVRLLAARRQRAEARAVLASLPRNASTGFPPETANLLDAMRFALADTFDELLAAAPRRPVENTWGYMVHTALDKPVFDEDAAEVFTYHLPLDRLIEASLGGSLPDRLRFRVATASFSRAVLLDRHTDAVRLAPVLRSLAPALKDDLDRMTAAATPADRHFAAVRLLLRTPGMHATVRGLENEVQYRRSEPMRRFEHREGANWWCTIPVGRPPDAYVQSALIRLVYDSAPVPAPAFLTTAERSQAASELQELRALGPATTWLGREAVKWANARPKDVEAAEALAQAVEGARWGCWNDKDAATSRRAFQTLHRLFPKSEWAKRTKYWY